MVAEQKDLTGLAAYEDINCSSSSLRSGREQERDAGAGGSSHRQRNTNDLMATRRQSLTPSGPHRVQRREKAEKRVSDLFKTGCVLAEMHCAGKRPAGRRREHAEKKKLLLRLLLSWKMSFS